MSIDFRGISSQTASRLFRYSTLLLTTVPLRYSSAVFLHIQYGLLTEEDKELPFARHVVGTLQDIYFIEDFVVVMLMGPEKVVISNPES